MLCRDVTGRICKSVARLRCKAEKCRVYCFSVLLYDVGLRDEIQLVILLAVPNSEVLYIVHYDIPKLTPRSCF